MNPAANDQKPKNPRKWGVADFGNKQEVKVEILSGVSNATLCAWNTQGTPEKSHRSILPVILRVFLELA
jgi:hypothetical protein